jgi:hypothetical protein
MEAALYVTSTDRRYEIALEKRDGELAVRVEDATTRTAGEGTGRTIILKLEPEQIVTMGNWAKETF